MIGENIRRYRKQKRMTLSDLASTTGISKSYLSYIERGIKHNPSIDVLEKITEALEINISSIITDSPAPTSNDAVIDEEWQALIHEAIQAGISKKQFRDFQKFIRYEKWTSFEKDKNTN